MTVQEHHFLVVVSSALAIGYAYERQRDLSLECHRIRRLHLYARWSTDSIASPIVETHRHPAIRVEPMSTPSRPDSGLGPFPSTFRPWSAFLITTTEDSNSFWTSTFTGSFSQHHRQ
jgi:hypothetical protein